MLKKNKISICGDTAEYIAAVLTWATGSKPHQQRVSSNSIWSLPLQRALPGVSISPNGRKEMADKL